MKNLLTNKTLKAFREWLRIQPLSIPDISRSICIYPTTIELFEQLPFSMKYGVIVDFFNDKDIWIQIIYKHQNGWDYKISYRNEKNMNPKKTFDANYSSGSYIAKPPLEAAITKANELFNQKN